MRRVPWILLGLVVVAAIALASYIYGNRAAKPAATTVVIQNPNPTETVTPSTVPSTPTTVPDAMATWKVLANANPSFNLKYPANLTVTTEADGSKHLLGTGVDLSFKAGPLNGKTVKEYADQRAAELGGVFETGPVTAVTVGKLQGFKFHVKGYAEGDYYYLDLGTNSYLEIFDASKDASVVAQILATLTP